MKSKKAQRLRLKIIHLLNITYLPDRQNVTSVKQLSRYSLKNCLVCLGKLGHTNKNITVSVYSPDPLNHQTKNHSKQPCR